VHLLLVLRWRFRWRPRLRLLRRLRLSLLPLRRSLPPKTLPRRPNLPLTPREVDRLNELRLALLAWTRKAIHGRISPLRSGLFVS
jgi:hypothetical protein